MRYKNELITESCFHLHKILDSVEKAGHMKSWLFTLLIL